MYITSDRYKEAILDSSRKFESEIMIGSRKITNEELINFSIQSSIQQDDTYTIGNAISSCLNINFLHDDIETDEKDLVNVKLGLLVDGVYEYVPLGIYHISNIKMNDISTELVCYDNMIKFEVPYIENNENPTLYSIINRLTELTGVETSEDLTQYTNYKLCVLENYTCREVLGYVAGVLGTNAIIDREGKFEFISISSKPIHSNEQLSDTVLLITKRKSVIMTKRGEFIALEGSANAESLATTERYYRYDRRNRNYRITKIINSTETNEISLGDLEEETMYLQTSNPFINEEILTDIYNKLNGLEFLPYNLNWHGDMAIELGDLITVTDKKGVTRVHPVLSHLITYNGALNCEVEAQGETHMLNHYKVSTKEESEADRTGKKIVKVEKEAGEVYVVVYDEENNASVRLTEKSLEAIAETIQLTAKNINLEGLVTANQNCRINEDGSIETSIKDESSGLISKTKMNKGILEGGIYFGEEQGQGYTLDSYGLNFLNEGGTSSANAFYALSSIYTSRRDGLIPFQVNCLGELMAGSGYTGLTSSFDEGLLVKGNLVSNSTIMGNRIDSDNFYANGLRLGYADVKASTSSNISVLYLGEILIQYARVSVTGLETNVNKQVDVNFKEEFQNSPLVIPVLNTSVPKLISTSVTGITNEKFTLNVTRENSTDTNVFWIAIGKAKPSSDGAVG